MTVKLLCDYPPYKAGNLFTSDSNTEAGLIAQHVAQSDLTGGTTYVPLPAVQRGSARARTSAQLAATPSNADLSMDGEFYLNTDPTQRYVINAAGTAYVSAGGGGGISTIASASDYNSTVVTPLNSKLNLSLGWSGTVPALASGTNPITAGFGSNSFVYTGAGTSPALDGATGVNGDVFIFGQGGTSTWVVVPKHDPSAVLTTQVGATGGVAPNGDSVQISGNVTISVANANVATYNGKVLEFTGAFSVTLAAGLPNDFGFAAIPPASGNASIVSDGTTTLNGATTTQTRAASAYTMFAVTQRNTSRNAYVVN